MDNDLRNCISNNPSAQEIDEILGKREGYLCLAETAAKLIQQNQTDLNEAQRVFGIEIKPFLTNAAIS